MRDVSFVSLAVRTTGRDPWRDRLMELAATRVLEGAIDCTYQSALTAPTRRRAQPDHWAQGDEVPGERPSFAEIEQALRELIGDLPLIGPDVHLHVEHLSAELARLDRPGLSNTLLDLAILADLALEPRAGISRVSQNSFGRRGVEGTEEKPTVLRLAQRLGLVSGPGRDLQSQTILTARVALELIGRLHPAYPAFDALVQAARRPASRALLETTRSRAMPSEPGVYLLRDESDRTLYVGKTSNLRSRVADYLGHAVSRKRAMDGLAEATARVDVQATGSDLEASLLEARLIRELRPRYNVQRGSRQPRLFLRIHLGEARPRLAPVVEARGDGATYLGPFRSSSAALRARRLASAVFGPLYVRPGEDEAIWRRRLQRALLFIAGAREEAIHEVRARMRQAAAEHDLMTVNRLRELLRQVQDFSVADSALSMDPLTDTFLAFDGRQAFLIRAGRLVRRFSASTLETARQMATAMGPEDDWANGRWGERTTRARNEILPVEDESRYVVLRWLAGRGTNWKIVRLDER